MIRRRFSRRLENLDQDEPRYKLSKRVCQNCYERERWAWTNEIDERWDDPFIGHLCPLDDFDDLVDKLMPPEPWCRYAVEHTVDSEEATERKNCAEKE